MVTSFSNSASSSTRRFSSKSSTPVRTRSPAGPGRAAAFRAAASRSPLSRSSRIRLIVVRERHREAGDFQDLEDGDAETRSRRAAGWRGRRMPPFSTVSQQAFLRGGHLDRLAHGAVEGQLACLVSRFRRSCPWSLRWRRRSAAGCRSRRRWRRLRSRRPWRRRTPTARRQNNVPSSDSLPLRSALPSKRWPPRSLPRRSRPSSSDLRALDQFGLRVIARRPGALVKASMASL